MSAASSPLASPRRPVIALAPKLPPPPFTDAGSRLVDDVTRLPKPTFVAHDKGEDWLAWHRNLVQLVRQGVALTEKEASQ